MADGKKELNTCQKLYEKVVIIILAPGVPVRCLITIRA